MTAAAMQLDLQASQERTRWSMSASFAVHLLVMLWIALMPRTGEHLPALTEITLIEPGELAAGSTAAAAPAARTELGAAVRNAIDASFRRITRQAEINPRPESKAAFDDRLESRLATLQREASTPSAIVQSPGVPSALWNSPALGPATGAPGGSGRVALTRGGEGGAGPPLQLSRGMGHGTSPAMVAAPAQGGDALARRNLAGAMLAGPIADRGVLSYATPVYPDWAKREGVEGSVTLYFVVRPDGSLKENVLVQKTAGFEDFDDSARSALRAWRFEPLHGGRTGEQWGTITFHFRLREAG